jgi:hypothetical protein
MDRPEQGKRNLKRETQQCSTLDGFFAKKKRARGKSIYPYLINFISLSLLPILYSSLIFIAGYYEILKLGDM